MANLSNNNFMCILCFQARAGYLQHYETIDLKEINALPSPAWGSQDDQYDMEHSAPADKLSKHERSGLPTGCNNTAPMVWQWMGQATPGWSDSGWDYSEEGH